MSFHRGRQEDEYQVLEREIGSTVSTAEKLRVQVETGGRLFGFGKRIVVPNDQIHVVSAAGYHTLRMSKETQIFGAAAEASTWYWQNPLSEVTAMRTVTFVVPVSGQRNMGVSVLDKNHVPYNATAHVVAKLDEKRADVAARSVGHDISSLVSTIEEVTEAELIDAAAEMTLEEVIKNRQQLAESAQNRIKATLVDLGYTLVLLKVSELTGEAYDKLVKQAQAGVTRDTTIKINAAELETNESVNNRRREEATVEAGTKRLVEQERLAAEQHVETLKIDKQETVSEREHQLHLQDAKRNQETAVRQHDVELRKIQLQEAEHLAQSTSEAEVSELRQKRELQLELQRTEAEANRAEVEQERRLARALQATQEEAKRLEEEELAEAKRDRSIRLEQANAEAEALEVEVDAQTRAEMLRAERQAEAAGMKAKAETQLAAATRAREAAPGLAIADVEARQVEIAADQVNVDRERGLAESEVAASAATAEIERERGLRQVEIDAQARLAELYEQNPVLVDLERHQREIDQQLEVVRLQTQAQVAIFEALAPNMNINIIGNGGQMGEIMTQVMALSLGADALKESSPLVGGLMSGNGNSSLNLTEQLEKFIPRLKTVVKGMKPRMFAGMTVEGFVNTVLPLLSGEDDLSAALERFRSSASFRMIADMPVTPLLERLGITPGGDDTIVLDEGEKRHG